MENLKKHAGTVKDIRIKSIKLKGGHLTGFLNRNPNVFLDPGPKYFTGWISDSPDEKLEGKKIKSAPLLDIDYELGYVETKDGVYTVADHPKLKVCAGKVLVFM